LDVLVASEGECLGVYLGVYLGVPLMATD
jgi:hypothetical protein